MRPVGGPPSSSRRVLRADCVLGCPRASTLLRMRFGEKENKKMMSTVLGGAMLPHAPQFFTMPETEEKKNVEQVRAVASEIGDKLRALRRDLWIIFSNDHAEQFFHNAAPPFTVHVGGEATG